MKTSNKTAAHLSGSVAILLVGLMIGLLGVPPALAQTASTGALTGTVTDPNGGAVPGASVHVINTATGESHEVISQPNGTYLAALLAPGTYRAEISKSGFKMSSITGITVSVTETHTANIKLEVGEVTQVVTVTAEGELLETQSQAQGHVTDERMVEGLPLVTRNYTQILALSPGISADVNNASALGAGTNNVSSHGAVTSDNNFQMNGAVVGDLLAGGASGSSTGSAIPIPNPDAIQEFKVQTGQYDASFGRNAGANVDVVTKGGGSQFHGNLFEFLRNDALNANDFFLNLSGKPRAVLKENQFGGNLGGPIFKDKLFFFVSYQGTRQRNGLAVGCLGSFNTPAQFVALGANRSAAALGAAFAGPGNVLGPPVDPSGSNVTPQAVALLNATFPGGGFLIPAPPPGGGTLSNVSQSCAYREDQFLANADYVQSDKSRWSERFFWANSGQATNFANNAGGTGGNVPGFPFADSNQYRDATVSNSYAFNSNLVNQAVIGFSRIVQAVNQTQATVNIPGQVGAAPLTLAALGINAPLNDSVRPAIGVLGSFNVGGNGNDGFHIAQNNYSFSDYLSYIHGRHSITVGGGGSWQQINFENFSFAGLIDFLSFQDFLTGHPFVVADLQGLVDRAWRATNADAYGQDKIKIFPSLTVTLGLRYERQGAIGDALGRSSNYDTRLLNTAPPAGGTLQGVVVGSNFQGTLPTGVTRGPNSAAINGDGQNDLAPRAGYVWKLPHTERLVLRGGYGMFYQRSTGQLFLQLIAVPPFSQFRVVGFPGIPPISAPFGPVPTFPSFAPLAYSPTTSLGPQTFSAAFQPSIVQQFSQSLQAELAKDLVLEIGYTGIRGTKLEVERVFNQAGFASVANPIHGATTNTIANIAQRAPFPGFSSSSAIQLETTGSSWYHALDVSLNKRFSHGLQFLAAYTWAKGLTDANNSSTGTGQGANLLGDQNNRLARWGQDGFIRPHRFVVSYVYSLPGPKDHYSLEGRFLAGWSVSGVTTIQSGQRLTFSLSNASNLFGITGVLNSDVAQIAAGCTNSQLVTPGSIQSNLTNYFNTACIIRPPIIGDPEPPRTAGACGVLLTCPQGTGFGNSSPGIVAGPGQLNFDFAIVKRTPLGLNESRNLEFRTEFFNAFNHTQFGNPVTNRGSGAFGHIQGTSVAPRIIQFALKLNF